MSALSHVRLNPFKTKRYTDAQATELRRLRALYTTHLVPVFGPALPDAFALETEGDEHYPRYTAKTLTPPPITSVPPSTALLTASYKSFADTLVATLAAYEAGRTHRWFGKGHPNDPTRLLGIFLRSTCDLWLSHASSNASTLRQVTALRQYLETLARERVFTREGEGHGSMKMLLHNLTVPLTLLERRLRHEISLQSAREHFNDLKEGVSNALNEAAQYLFYALAVKDRSDLPFSLVNMQARIVNKPLSKALQTREGLLLKQWVYSPGITRTLLPQRDAKDAKSAFTHPPVSLFGVGSPTPLLDEKGGAHPAWCGFLERSSALEAPLDTAVKKLPSGVCPVLLESKALPAGEKTLVADAIQLHGLLEELAGYQAYLQECWQLAGFGGDHCVYDQIVEAVVSILTELQGFNQALAGRLDQFQERLDLGYKIALEATTHLEWQANYRQAKAHQEKLLGMLTGCDTALTRVIAHAQDPAARSERRVLATKSYEALKSAATFLNQTRAHVGLAPKAHYPGLEAPSGKAVLGSFGLLLAPEHMTMDQILITLLPQSPQEVAQLSKLCAKTPTHKPWSGFKGRTQRYTYFHNNTRLARIAQDLMHWQFNAQTSMTAEKSAFIAELSAQLEQEQAQINTLSQALSWPFQRASLRLFAALQRGIAEKLRDLKQMQVTLVHPVPQPAPSVQVVQEALLRGEATLLEAKRCTERTTKAKVPEPLSMKAEERLVKIYQNLGRLTPEQRENFNVWQQNRFGEKLWNEHGTVRSDLTESDGSAVLDQWADYTLQRAQSAVASLHITHHQLVNHLQDVQAVDVSTVSAVPPA